MSEERSGQKLLPAWMPPSTTVVVVTYSDGTKYVFVNDVLVQLICRPQMSVTVAVTV